MCQWFIKSTMVDCGNPATSLLVIRTPFEVYSLELCGSCADEVKQEPLNEILYEVGLAIPFQGEPVGSNQGANSLP